MNYRIFANKNEAGCTAAADGAALIRRAIAERGRAVIILATGASQFEMLRALTNEPDIAWDHVTAFHLDEYVGLPIAHPASFRLYLWQRFASKLPTHLAAFHYLNGEKDPRREAKRVSALIEPETVDVAFIGIGENAHLAFNDPPADFQTNEPFIIVELDEACRRQQNGEGWFPNFDDVPQQAISMSIRQILKSRAIICTVPDLRKAVAVKAAIEGPLTPEVPASILREHADCTIYLDGPAASLLTVA